MITNKGFVPTAVLLSSLAAITTPALALEQGDWLLRFGASQVAPNDDSGATGLGATTRVGVDSGESLSFNIGYMLTDNVAVDVLAAWPFIEYRPLVCLTIAKIGYIEEEIDLIRPLV